MPFFPLYDEDAGRGGHPVHLGLILLNVLVFVLTVGWLEEAVRLLGLVPRALVHGFGLLTPLTSMFLHGGWEHLVGNMWYFWVFGDNIERSVGSRRFLVLYLVSGLAGALLQMAVDPQSNAPMVGASGAISGILAAYLIQFPGKRVRVLFLDAPLWVSAWVVLSVWFVLQAVLALASFVDPSLQGVAYLAHIGGFLTGWILGIAFWRGAEPVEGRVDSRVRRRARRRG